MSFTANLGRRRVEPTVTQCEMIEPHYSDCTCASCVMRTDVQCLDSAVGTVPNCAHIRVCADCAKAMEAEGFVVTYYDAPKAT